MSLALHDVLAPLRQTGLVARAVLGWLAGGPSRSTRAAVVPVTGVRANALALGTGRLRVGNSVEPQFHPHRMMSDPMPSHSFTSRSSRGRA